MQPSDAERERKREYYAKWYAEKRKDPEWVQKERKRLANYQNKRRKEDPEYRKKCNEERKARYAVVRHDVAFLARKREEGKKYRADPKNHAKLKAYARIRYEKRRNDLEARLQEYKDNAAANGREFLISDEDAMNLFQGDCFYCGKSAKTALNGIDRQNNKKTYLYGNGVSCCSHCNFAKHTLKVSTFMAMCRDIVKKHDLLNPEKQFICDDCGTTRNNERNLEIHQLVVHAGPLALEVERVELAKELIEAPRTPLQHHEQRQ